MQLQFLGTGAGMPSKERKTSALVMKLLDELGTIWLFDCGEATQHQILETTIKPRKIDKIFVTHLHGDHIYGLPGFIGSRSFLGGDTPLTIYGPKGLKEWVTMTNAVTGTHLTYPLHFVEVEEGVVFENEHFIVRAMPLEHVVPCFGYRIEQKPLAGALDIVKATALGVPKGPLLGRLKAGEHVTLADGTIVQSEDVLSEPQLGFVVTILGDTRQCANALTLAQQADVLVHESTFDHATAQLARRYGHSTNTEAATVAKRARVGTLLLNHLSARFLAKDLARMTKEARAIHEKTYLVEDFSTFEWRQQQLIKQS